MTTSEPEALLPIDMVLFCPKCGQQHIDQPDPADDWENPPHRSHKCVGPNGCGCVWRPADVPTNGVIATETRGSKDTIFYDRAALTRTDAGEVSGETLADQVRAIAEDSDYSNEMVGIAVRNWFHRRAMRAAEGRE